MNGRGRRGLDLEVLGLVLLKGSVIEGVSGNAGDVLCLFRGFRGFFAQAKFKVQLGFDIRPLGVVCYGVCVSVCVCERAAKLLEKDSAAASLRSCC